MIRKAIEEDIPYITETGMRLHARSGNADVAVHKPTVFLVLREFIVARDKVLIVSERDEIIRGFVMASCEPFWWADPVRGRRYVTDWAFYSEHRGDGVLMLRAVQEWAWMQPRVIEMACATNVPYGRNVMEGMFKKAGFEHVGGRFKIAKPDG